MITKISHNKFKVVVSVRGIGKRQTTLTGSLEDALKTEENLKINLLEERNPQIRIETFGNLFTLYHSTGTHWSNKPSPRIKEVLKELTEFNIGDYARITAHLATVRAESPYLYNQTIAIINHSYRDAYKKGLIPFPLKEKVNIATVPDYKYEIWCNVRDTFLNNPVIGDFLRFAETTPYNPKDLAELTRENVKLNGNLIWYQIEGNTKIIPISNWARDYLQEKHQSDIEGKLFGISYEAIQGEWLSISRRVNVPLRLFDMHRFATRKLTEQGICLEVAKTVAHWKCIGNLKQYQMVSVGKSQETWRTIEHRLQLLYLNLAPEYDEFLIGTYKEAYFIAALINLSQLPCYSGILDSSVKTTIGEVKLSELVQKGFYVLLK